MIITSGTGNEYSAGVNPNNRLETFSIVEDRMADISNRTGESFVLATDFVSLTTTGSFNGLIYVKNNNDKTLYIQRIRTCSTATGSVQCILISNPTAGTLISDANLSDQRSANMGSNEVFSNFGLSYAASGDGKTVTDGDQFSNFINRSPGHSIQEYNGAIILPKGSSIALSAKPSVATTVCVEIQGWFE